MADNLLLTRHLEYGSNTLTTTAGGNPTAIERERVHKMRNEKRQIANRNPAAALYIDAQSKLWEDYAAGRIEDYLLSANVMQKSQFTDEDDFPMPKNCFHCGEPFASHRHVNCGRTKMAGSI